MAIQRSTATVAPTRRAHPGSAIAIRSLWPFLVFACAFAASGCQSRHPPSRRSVPGGGPAVVARTLPTGHSEVVTDAAHHENAGAAVGQPATPAAASATALAPDEGVTQSRPVASGAYDLGAQVVPNAPGHKAKVRAFVRWPADAKPGERLPIAFLVHGNNGVCRDATGTDRCGRKEATSGVCHAGETATPNAEGLLWLADRLARAGWIAVSVDANSVNCSGLPIVVQGRTRLIVEHLRFWRVWQTGGLQPKDLIAVPFADLTRVALVGHSNGAEASVRVPEALATYAWDPRLHTVQIRAVVAVASSDSTEARLLNASLMHITAGCDRQLPENDGVRILDRTLKRRRSAVVQAVFPTASHNGFLSTWGTQENDRPGWRMCPGVQPTAPAAMRDALAALVLPFLSRTVRAKPRALPAWLLGDAAPPAEVARAIQPALDLRIHGAPRQFRLIERHGGLRKAGVGFLGGAIRANAIAGGPCFADDCSDVSPNVAWSTFVAWKSADAALLHGIPELDFSAWKTIAVRIGLAPDAPTAMPFTLVLRDRSGLAGGVPAHQVRTGQPPPRHAQSDDKTFVRPDMQTFVRFPLAQFRLAEPRLDLRHIVSVEFHFDTPAAGKAGSLVLGDVELTTP